VQAVVSGGTGTSEKVEEALEAAKDALLTAKNTIECQSLFAPGHPRAGEPLEWHQKATEALKLIGEVRAMPGAPTTGGAPWNPRPKTLAEARACPTCYRPPEGFEFIGDALQRDRSAARGTLEDQLVALLLPHAGSGGQTEGAADCLKRLLDEREQLLQRVRDTAA